MTHMAIDGCIDTVAKNENFKRKRMRDKIFVHLHYLLETLAYQSKKNE